MPPRVYRVPWHPMQAPATCAESSRWPRSTSMVKVLAKWPSAPSAPHQGGPQCPFVVLPGRCPSSAPHPPKVAPGGSGQLGTPSI
eukprot:scaffold97012_cov51-Phaeocystis_antarctica.AAC.1